jgi:TfoX/Sxy family transcriptional regulator of competence genes
MAYNEAFTLRVRQALEGVKKVEEKRMFRGVAFMVNGKICVSVGDDELMCRIDPEVHDKAIAKEGCRTMVMKGREYRGYIYVHADVLKTRKDLDRWLQLALDFNGRAKASKKKTAKKK